jgi:hypothetical protein
MNSWNNGPEWVNDDGLRCYFTQPNPGGPSQLECYRRLLAEPVGVKGTARHHPDVGLFRNVRGLARVALGVFRGSLSAT